MVYFTEFVAVLGQGVIFFKFNNYLDFFKIILF